jgi:hypothetical protein
MSDQKSLLAAAERRLALARAEQAAAYAAGRSSEVMLALYTAVLAAERALACAQGEQYAIEIDFPLRWDRGAPIPHLLMRERTAFLLFVLHNDESELPARTVRVRQRTIDRPVGIVEFHGCLIARLGHPNDEAREGHPLEGKGLGGYRAHEVLNSRWIAEHEAINAVHPQHTGNWHARLHHYLFGFHDSTFECIAAGYSAERLDLAMPLALRQLCDRLF